MILQDIKETICYGHKNVSDTRSDNVKTVYPPTNTVCGGIDIHARVMVLVHDTSSQSALQIYEVSLKYL